MSRVRRQDPIKCCYLGSYVKDNARAFVASGLPYICWNHETLDRSGRGTMESASMSLLTSSIESTRLTRWNFGLGALTLEVRPVNGSSGFELGNIGFQRFDSGL